MAYLSPSFQVLAKPVRDMPGAVDADCWLWIERRNQPRGCCKKTRSRTDGQHPVF